MKIEIDFKPCSKGCGSECEINKKETDICCKSARQCCFYCFEECPIKDEYKKVINTAFQNNHSHLYSHLSK